jgi:nucleotide-binding universal stress UspA family protein
MEGTQMSKKFLVAVDGSDHGWKALDLATDLAAVSDAELILLHVVPYEPMPEGLEQYAKIEGIPVEEMKAQFHYSTAIGDRITSEAEARVRKNGLARVTTRVLEGNPANEIVALARSQGADMVFIGSRGLGDVGGLLIGSVSHKVMHLAPCTCVAVK